MTVNFREAKTFRRLTAEILLSLIVFSDKEVFLHTIYDIFPVILPPKAATLARVKLFSKQKVPKSQYNFGEMIFR